MEMDFLDDFPGKEEWMEGELLDGLGDEILVLGGGFCVVEGSDWWGVFWGIDDIDFGHLSDRKYVYFPRV